MRQRSLLARLLLAVPLTLATSVAQDAPIQRDLLNRNLPSWLTLTHQSRVRWEGPRSLAFDPQENDGYLVSRLRFGFRARAGEWFQVEVQGQDSRAAGLQPGPGRPASRNPLDLYQAKLLIGDDSDGWWDLTIGRQEFQFGYERLLGTREWSNLGRGQDAIKLGLHHGQDRLDIFSSSVVVADPEGFDNHAPGEKIHGAYASISSWLPRAVFEPHALYRSRSLVVDESGFGGDSGIWTAGFRLSGEPRPNWDFDLELDWQFGTYGRSDLKAWRALGLVGYRFPGARFKPRLVAEYSFASGDAVPGDGRVGTFDQLYVRAHRLRGITDQVGDRNSKSLRAGVQLHPHPKWTIQIDQFSFWLASANDGLYRHNGLLVVPPIPGGASSAHIGEEIDVVLDYQPNPHVSIGLGLGFLAAGKFLKEHTGGGCPAIPYVVVQFDL